MSEESTSQTNIEDVQDQSLISSAPQEQESKSPAPIYEETEEDKALKASEQEAGDKSEQEVKDQDLEDSSEKQDDEQKEDKSEEEKKALDYDSLDVPEDTPLQKEEVERILKQSKEEGLSKDDAQKRLEEADTLVKGYALRSQQALEQAADQWIQDTKNDKEIGGERYKESVELARRTAHKFGTPEFLDSLNKTGFGNHPEVIRVFARIGRQMQDDKLITDGTQNVHKSGLELRFIL